MWAICLRSIHYWRVRITLAHFLIYKSHACMLVKSLSPFCTLPNPRNLMDYWQFISFNWQRLSIYFLKIYLWLIGMSRMEKIEVGSIRSTAKIGGTILCMGGAISMALLRGPKILNTSILGGQDWLLGCFCLFSSACTWSFWLILQVFTYLPFKKPNQYLWLLINNEKMKVQVPVTKCCKDHLSVSAWMCFTAAVQSAGVAVFVETDPDSWKLHSYLQLFCCLFTVWALLFFCCSNITHRKLRILALILLKWTGNNRIRTVILCTSMVHIKKGSTFLSNVQSNVYCHCHHLGCAVSAWRDLFGKVTYITSTNNI